MAASTAHEQIRIANNCATWQGAGDDIWSDLLYLRALLATCPAQFDDRHATHYALLFSVEGWRWRGAHSCLCAVPSFTLWNKSLHLDTLTPMITHIISPAWVA